MIFKHPITGFISHHPFAPTDGYTRWMDMDGCIKCTERGDVGPKLRYVEGNHCSLCVHKDVDAVWNEWCQGAPDRPDGWATTPEQAVAMGQDWYYGSPSYPRVCVDRMHLRKTHIVTKRCVACAEATRKTVTDGRTTASRKFAKDNPEYIIDRESARSLGFTLYRTGLACRRGHAGWRYVSTGNCVECHDK